MVDSRRDSFGLPLKVRGIKGVIFITPLPLLFLRGEILEEFSEIQMLKCRFFQNVKCKKKVQNDRAKYDKS
jgi:hypothetical protein